jgi:hypothetical protein
VTAMWPSPQKRVTPRFYPASPGAGNRPALGQGGDVMAMCRQLPKSAGGRLTRSSGEGHLGASCASKGSERGDKKLRPRITWAAAQRPPRPRRNAASAGTRPGAPWIGRSCAGRLMPEWLPSRPLRNWLRRTTLALKSCCQSRRDRPTQPVGLSSRQ